MSAVEDVEYDVVQAWRYAAVYCYPKNLVTAFHAWEVLAKERRARTRERYKDDPPGAVRGLLYRATTAEPPPPPSDAVLRTLAETAFFASLMAEEGQRHPISLVHVPSLDALTSVQLPRWQLTPLAKPEALDVSAVCKLSSACVRPNAFLVVAPQGDELFIVGFAKPEGADLFGQDSFVRVRSLRPGAVTMTRGAAEGPLLEHGAIIRRLPSPVSDDVVPQVDAISLALRKSAGEESEEAAWFSVGRGFTLLLQGMVTERHGGLIAILAPDEEFDLQGRPLDPPIRFGRTLFDFHRAHNTLTTDRRVRERTDAALQHHVAQIVGLSTVDGAVLLTSDLDVISFGEKLAIDGNWSEPVLTRAGAKLTDLSVLKKRGTRHRAAAFFASKSPGRISMLASEDGDAATFQRIDGKVVHCPLQHALDL